VPFDSLATAIGHLAFGINYNSQENVDYGLTGGWSLDIGPSSSRRDVPLELVKLVSPGSIHRPWSWGTPSATRLLVVWTFGSS
jgi:hypothetical protein